MFNNMLSSIGSSVLRVKGGSYLQKEAEKAKSQAQESEAARAAAEAQAEESKAVAEASRSSVSQAEQKNLGDALRKKYMPKDLDDAQKKDFRDELRKQVRGLDEKVWNSYMNEYLRATSQGSVIDRIAMLEKARGQKFELPKIGGKK